MGWGSHPLTEETDTLVAEDAPRETPATPEPVDVDAQVVRRLVGAQFPRWAGLEVVPVGTPGVDNMTFRLGDAMSVRMPRFARWVGQVRREQRWLPWLGERLPLPVPVPMAQGEPGEGYPFVWSVYRWLDGEQADLASLADPRRAAVQLGVFLRTLQGLDATDGPTPGWSNGFRGVDLADPRDSPVVAGRMRARITALEGLTDTDGLTAVWEAALAAPGWDGPPVWIHGDPAPGNLLAEDGRLSAVIDFGTLAVGDPACDLIAAWTFLDAPTREVFRATLGVDDATWARGRGWGLSGVLAAPDRLTDGARRRIDDIVADARADA